MILRFLIRRILALIPVVLGVTIVTFGIMHLTAGGHIPGLQLSPSLRPDEVAQIRHQLGLDRWAGLVNRTDHPANSHRCCHGGP